MSNPSKIAEFNDALKRMLGAKPKQNKNLKLGQIASKPPRTKQPKPWPWSKS